MVVVDVAGDAALDTGSMLCGGGDVVVELAESLTMPGMVMLILCLAWLMAGLPVLIC